MKKFGLAIFALFLAINLTACGITDTQTWKSTRNLYYNYLNTPLVLELENPATLAAADKSLVLRIMPIDEQLVSLERALDAIADVNDQVVSSVMQRFPWLTGLVLVLADGTIAGSLPPSMVEKFNYQELLTGFDALPPRALRAMVQEGTNGPEVLIARPLYMDAELAALLVVAFDLRNLLPYAGNAQGLLIQSPDTILWDGGLALAPDSEGWQQRLKSTSYGLLPGQNLTWLVRYVSTLPLIFGAVPNQGQ